MRKFLGNIVLILSIITAFYVGGYEMIIYPIIECVNAYSNETLEFWLVFWSVTKIICSELVMGLIILLGTIIRAVIVQWNEITK